MMNVVKKIPLVALLVLFVGLREIASQEVALIVGGVEVCASSVCFDDHQPDPNCDTLQQGITQNFRSEIFGCPANSRVQLPLFPSDITYTAGVYDKENRRVIVCGGLPCFNALLQDGSSNRCYEWSPYNFRQGWIEIDTMNQGRASHLLVPSPEPDSSWLAVGGFPDLPGDQFTTEVLGTDGWTTYKNLPAGLIAADNGQSCMIAHNGKLYVFDKRVTEVTLSSWTLQDLGETPIFSGNVGECAMGTRNGNAGVLMRDMWWFDLVTLEFEAQQLATPPLPSIVGAYSLYTLNGKPTIFGVPICDDNGCVSGTQVVQLDAEANTWSAIGDMASDAFWQHVIAIPEELCDVEPPAPPVLEGEVAVVVGGVQICASVFCFPDPENPPIDPDCPDIQLGVSQTERAEVFGCALDAPVQIPPFPTDITFTSGVWDEDNERLLVCGGITCFNVLEQDASTNKCYSWYPYEEGSGWVETEPMTQGRASLLLVPSPAADSSWLAIGGYPSSPDGSFTAEVLGSDGWTAYNNFPPELNIADDGRTCLVELNGKLFVFDTMVREIDLSDWTVVERADTPIFSGNVGECAKGTRNGNPGVLIRNGYWFDLVTFEWEEERLARPPIPSVVGSYSMYTLQGKPTIFGVPECTLQGCVSGTEVIQFEPDTEEWSVIGYLKTDAFWQYAIAVPSEVCNGPRPPTTPNTGSVWKAGASFVAFLYAFLLAFTN